MSILKKLLELDNEKLKLNHKKLLEIPRLSDILGQPFIIELSPITFGEIDKISETSSTDTEFVRDTILNSCKIDGKSFNDKDILDKFKCSSDKVLTHIFLAGEIQSIKKQIDKISGYRINAVNEVKKH